MQDNQGIWFPDADFFEDVIIHTIPVLFPNYEGGLPDFQYLGGLQGRGAFESALAQPQQTFYGEYLYPSITDKAAALIWSITKNHPFTDGNKRTALTTGFFFLAFNGYALLAGQGEAVDLCLRVAASEQGVDQKYVSEWIDARIVRFDELDSAGARQDAKVARYVQSATEAEIAAVAAFYKAAAEILRAMYLGKDA